MRVLMMMSAMLLLATGALFAQGFGGLGASETIMLNTPKGLFALRSGVLVKYSLTPLKQMEKQNLFGAMPTPPARDAGQEAWQTYMAETQKRNAPPVMIAKDNSLLLVIGDVFARYNMDTLAPEASGNLRSPTATPAANAGGRGMRMQEQAPSYLLVGNTLYLMRSRELLAVNIIDGKVLERTDLPAEMLPQQMNFGGGNRGGATENGGGRGGAGGGGRGN